MTRRVLHLTTIPVTARRFVLPLAQALGNSGFRVELATGPGEELEGLKSDAHPIPVHVLPLSRRLLSPGSARALWGLRALLEEGSFWGIHTHTPVASVVGRLAANPRKHRVLYTLHGSFWGSGVSPLRSFLFTALERTLAPRTHLAFVQNEADGEDMVRKARIPPERVVLLPAGGAGVSEEFFSPGERGEGEKVRAELGIPPGAPVVGFVGRPVTDKGILELATAFRRIRAAHPDACLLLVGGGLAGERGLVEEEELRRLLGPEAPGLRYTGFREEILPYYRAMDLLVLPSHREGFGMSVAEAAAAGLPVVATRTRGAGAAVQDGRTGILVPIGDGEALAGAMEKVLADPAGARAMGEAGSEVARKRFSRGAVLGRYLAAYRCEAGGD